MDENKQYDVIIVGGSYSGLAAGMALGRALRRVLIVDGGVPCNRQTPYSHNFITQDGVPPLEIAALARQQVASYPTVELMTGLVTDVIRTEHGFDVQVDNSTSFSASKLVFATGVRDVMPDIKGFAECWGISVLHCPYCHGYEVRDEATGVLGNGERAFELARLISNWTKDLTLFTDGPSTLTAERTAKLREHHIRIVETAIAELEHAEGQLQRIHLKDGSARAIHALYAMPVFVQHCTLPQHLGCALTDEGYLKVDAQQQTSVPGIYACGDSTTRLRTVANAVATGTTAGMMLNKELITEEF
ncbi:MAG: NAD(P)/FAD-dependent oxidoreductase [Flavobacteriales bacterium]|nr:NAD(P)/FAD-dependent oxidoreductase [Flavobacteriales bacterium]MBP6696944.1 NAD(P)/FAD-dependent oxidoreductase [Flavobacteriales bacterium]